jgi:alpha-galactosidase
VRSRTLQARARCLGSCILLPLALLLFSGCRTSQDRANQQSAPASKISVDRSAEALIIKSPAAEFKLFANGYLEGRLAGATPLTLDERGSLPGLMVTVGGKPIQDFTLDLAGAKVVDPRGKLGTNGKRIEVQGTSANLGLAETLVVELYEDFPAMAILSADFRNVGNTEVDLNEVELQRHRLNASSAEQSAAHHQMWTFAGSSLKWGKDEIFPLPAKFSEENPFGTVVETKDDLGRVGGGVPVVAFWTRHVGEAVGHLETVPLVLSIPVKVTEEGFVQTGVRVPANTALKPGETFSTPRTLLTVYSGDYYEPLDMWSRALDREGLSKPANNEENYAVSWCGWGYESDVTPKQMVDTIPKLHELGIHWATLDDRWFNNYGDWQPRADTFGGDSIGEMVKTFHRQGIKVQLWWLPLGVEDGRFKYGDHQYVVSDVVRDHRDWLILDKSGQPARMTRNLAALCPALPEVREYYKRLTERFIRDWDFDGHKLDNIYATPRCYNPKHHHQSPNDSVYAMGEVYKTIFETTRALKPNSVTQSCPCGTPPSLSWMRYMDQAVTADPVGSVQVRRRIKMYKALLGPHAAVYGDHVELTRLNGAFTDHEEDVGTDFASTLGTGGVLGTKFTWPDYGPKFKTVYLNSKKFDHWKTWISLYQQKMLSKGTFRNLYVYGYDVPEGYAIDKDGSTFYAFYAPQEGTWKGEIELRGLSPGEFHVVDYVNHRDYGKVQGPVGKLNVEIKGNLLVEATPVGQTR